jgi:hypothetical protein
MWHNQDQTQVFKSETLCFFLDIQINIWVLLEADLEAGIQGQWVYLRHLETNVGLCVCGGGGGWGADRKHTEQKEAAW